MNTWYALGFMLLGGLIVEFYNFRAWKMYLRGRGERAGLRAQ